MKIDDLQKRKEILIHLVKAAQHDKFMAEQQDCYGMAPIIDKHARDVSFKTQWLGEIQNEIDKLNKENA